MPLKIAICDDNPADIRYVSGLVRSWAGERPLQAGVPVIQTFPSAEAFLFQFAEQKDYDILLVDVEMGGMDGVSMAKTVRKENRLVQIVFITGYLEYIAEGYEVSALHYLLKPVQEEKLFQVLDRAVENLKKNERVLTLMLHAETVRIPFHEIRYLEVQSNYVTVHAAADIRVKKTLTEFEQELDERFYRMGRSYMINLSFIRKVTKTEVHLSDGTVLPLPRGQYEALNRAIIQS